MCGAKVDRRGRHGGGEEHVMARSMIAPACLTRHSSATIDQHPDLQSTTPIVYRFVSQRGS